MLRNLLTLAAVALSTAAQAAERPRSGVYSNVRISPQTGDAGGVEIELHADGPTPYLVFTVCQGGCWGGKTWPASVSKGQVAFHVTEEWADESGRIVDRPTLRYAARPRRGALILESPDRPEIDGVRLKRVARPAPGRTAALATR